MDIPRKTRGLKGDRRGAIVVLVGVSIVALMGMLVLAIDGGSIQRQRRMEQTAADAAALAGAIEIFRNRTDSVQASAKGEARRNGFVDSVGGDFVTVTYPATSGTFIGDKYVQVTVERTLPTVFASFFGRGSVVIRSHATAGIAPSDYCFIVLDPTHDNALELDNSAQLTGSGCGVDVNSTSPIGANVAGNSARIVAPFIGVAGPSAGGPEKMSPAPQYNVPPMPDPMSQLTMPTIPNTCDYGSPSSKANLSGTITLSPGTYCGGITVNGNFTLSPGLYILRGGGLNVTGGGNTLRSTGSGVTFINTAPPPGASYDWGPIFVQSGSVNIDISANTDPDSALPGVLFYTDPAAPFMVNLFKANSITRMDGTMYFPTGLVKFESGASFTINGALVAYRVQMSQSADVTFTGYGGGTDYLALKRAAVVE